MPAGNDDPRTRDFDHATSCKPGLLPVPAAHGFVSGKPELRPMLSEVSVITVNGTDSGAYGKRSHPAGE